MFAPRGAGLYNAAAPAILGSLYRRVAADVVTESRLAGLADVSSVLEIGSGPGELAVEIARCLPDTEVVGIDLAQAMIDRTRRELEAFLSSGSFDGARLEREPLGSGWLAILFVRIRLVRPRTA